MTKPTKVVPKVEELVPPLATGRMPVTLEVKLIWLAVKTCPAKDRYLCPAKVTSPVLVPLVVALPAKFRV